jgi:uncharacterized protein (DUF1015 family)
MPEIHPFRALRYAVPDLSKVVAQPYDKVGDKLREEYYARHPNHVIRLDRRKEEPNDGHYASAAADLNRWISEGVLVEDEKPAIYAVRQTYKADGATRVRRGLSAMVGLEEFGKGRIHPHEETHAGPKIDRLKLLRAAQTHIGHIFMLYPDPENAIGALLDPEMKRSPDLKAIDDFGETHEAWRITDEKLLRRISEAFKSIDLYIADGHHRYETALAYRQENKAAGAVLSTLIDMDDEGLVCFPTHRVIRDHAPLDPAAFSEKLKTDFDIREHADRASMLEAVRSDGKTSPTFGLALPGKLWSLKVRDVGATAERVGSDRSLDWRSLDVNILHTVILEKLLGITPDDTAHERFVDYVRSADEAVERVSSGRAVAAFLLNPVRMDQLQAVVRHGEKFPQKSTDFYPKMLSGYLMCRLKGNP